MFTALERSKTYTSAILQGTVIVVVVKEIVQELSAQGILVRFIYSHLIHLYLIVVFENKHSNTGRPRKCANEEGIPPQNHKRIENLERCSHCRD